MSSVSALTRNSISNVRNIGRALRSQSRFKILFIFMFGILFELGLFILFLDGFQLLSRFSATGLLIVPKLFALFFFGMGLMLVFSACVSSYTTIFRSDEIPFLLVRPFSMSEIVLYRFAASTVLSSWAFLFIMLPFVMAFAIHQEVSPLFVVWTAVYSLPFLIVCSAIGSLATMLVVRWWPKSRFTRYFMLLAAGVVIAAVHLAGRSISATDIGSNLALSRLVPGMRFASNELLPSFWFSEGILSITRSQWSRGIMFWLLLASHAGVLTLIVEKAGSAMFYEAWQRVSSGSSGSARGSIPGSIVKQALFFVKKDVKAMIVKDVKTFCRDPMQWSQALIFFGLLALYFSNLRTFNYHTYAREWRNLIAFLNVFSVSAVMCSLGSRFVYPQLSLEGHGFWILGLAPTSMTRILVAKFASSVAGMSILSVGLMLLSASMLEASLTTKVVSSVIALAVAFAVCALSTGLGGVFLNHEAKNPAAIVSGFGGTLNLVFCLCFMLAAILPFAVIFHLRLGGMLANSSYLKAMSAASAWLLLITVTATWVPLVMGIKSLARREY